MEESYNAMVSVSHEKKNEYKMKSLHENYNFELVKFLKGKNAPSAKESSS